jgi:hypothetical protein
VLWCGFARFPRSVDERPYFGPLEVQRGEIASDDRLPMGGGGLVGLLMRIIEILRGNRKVQCQF